MRHALGGVLSVNEQFMSKRKRVRGMWSGSGAIETPQVVCVNRQRTGVRFSQALASHVPFIVKFKGAIFIVIAIDLWIVTSAGEYSPSLFS